MRRNLVAFLFALPFLAPLVFLVGAAFTPPGAFMRGHYFGFPPTLQNFALAWKSATFLLYYRNTIVYTLGVLAVQVVTVTLAAYALTRIKVVGRQVVFYLILLQLFLPPVALILPNYLTLISLHLVNTLAGLALPYLASATGIFLLRQGFRNISFSFDEAAMMDGARPMQILWRVLVPMVKPQLAAFAIVSIMYHWNEFLWPLVATSTNGTRVLAVGLESFTRASESGAEWGLIAAGTLFVIVPLFVVFLAFQRFFIQSFARSSIKG